MDKARQISSLSTKEPLFMDRIIYMLCSIRKNPCFTDGTFKFPNLIRN